PAVALPEVFVMSPCRTGSACARAFCDTDTVAGLSSSVPAYETYHRPGPVTRVLSRKKPAPSTVAVPTRARGADPSGSKSMSTTAPVAATGSYSPAASRTHHPSVPATVVTAPVGRLADRAVASSAVRYRTLNVTTSTAPIRTSTGVAWPLTFTNAVKETR